MNNRSKGRMYELLCKKKLEENGYLVHLTDMPQRFKKNQDIWGIWDIIALKKESVPNRTNEALAVKLFVQVKHHDYHRKQTLIGMREFKARWLGTDDLVQLWNYLPSKKGWEIVSV
jgi:hypothetical protein